MRMIIIIIIIVNYCYYKDDNDYNNYFYYCVDRLWIAFIEGATAFENTTLLAHMQSCSVYTHNTARGEYC